MPNRSWRRSAFPIRSWAILTVCRSRVERFHGRNHRVLLLFSQLRVNRQGQYRVHGGLRSRQTPGAVPQMRKAGLEVECKWIVNGVTDALPLEMSLQLIPLGDANGVLMKDVVVGRIDRRGTDRRVASERLGVACRIPLSRLIPPLEIGQLGQQTRGLQRVQPAVGPNRLRHVLPGSAVESETPQPFGQLIVLGDD